MDKAVEVTQDFSRRMAIVVRKDLPGWQVANVIAHIAAYLGNKLGDRFGTGDAFVTKDGARHPRNTQYPIIVFAADGDADLRKLIGPVRASGLPYIGFIREMIETTDDAEIERVLAEKADSEIEYLGIGFFGENDAVKTLAKKFSLWK